MLIIATLILIISILGYLRIFWWCNVLDFFRLQYAVLSIFFVIPAVFYYQDFYSAGLLILAGTINLWRIRGFLWRSNSRFEKSEKRQIISINCQKDNTDANKIADLIRVNDPDIILLMEISNDNMILMKSALEQYDYKLSTYVRDGFSIGLFSKHPLEDDEIIQCGGAQTPMLLCFVTINNERYRLIGVHPRPSLSPSWHRARVSYFNSLKSMIDADKTPTIMLGDFNSVLWEPHFKSFLRESNLVSTLSNERYRMTWPVNAFFMGVPMDHILLSKNIEYKHIYIGPNVGSDHYPISINLSKDTMRP